MCVEEGGQREVDQRQGSEDDGVTPEVVLHLDSLTYYQSRRLTTIRPPVAVFFDYRRLLPPVAA